LQGRVLKGAAVACAGRSPKTFDPPLVLLPETGAQVQVTVPLALLIARGVWRWSEVMWPTTMGLGRAGLASITASGWSSSQTNS
jgi:hypothetical protein